MILVVDDTPANIDIILAIIGEMDDISVALDGEEALSIVEEEKPSLILLDIIMDGIDGYEVCRRLKANSETSSIPIIFLSGNGNEEDQEKGFELGAAGFLVKPIDPELLVSTIKPYI